VTDEALFHQPGSPLPAEAQELWEVNSEWWQESFTEGADPEYTEQIVPLLLEHLAPAAPARVLDIGCGEGQLSRLVATLPGVRQVVGIDPTKAQLTVARHRQPVTGPPMKKGVGETDGTPEGEDPQVQAPTDGAPPGRAPREGALTASDVPRYVRAPAAPAAPQYVRATAGALPFPDGYFDAAFACLVFEHIEGTAGAVAEVGRALRSGGTFLLFLNHPLLQAPGSGWVDDHILGEQYWRIGPYLTEHHAVEEVDKDVWIPFVHRPLSVYVNALVDAGLYLTAMLEPPPPAGFLERADEYQEAAAFPRLLVLQAEKLARPGGRG
jgi:SAM-dependent methyltransferase